MFLDKLWKKVSLTLQENLEEGPHNEFRDLQFTYIPSGSFLRFTRYILFR